MKIKKRWTCCILKTRSYIALASAVNFPPFPTAIVRVTVHDIAEMLLQGVMWEHSTKNKFHVSLDTINPTQSTPGGSAD